MWLGYKNKLIKLKKEIAVVYILKLISIVDVIWKALILSSICTMPYGHSYVSTSVCQRVHAELFKAVCVCVSVVCRWN